MPYCGPGCVFPLPPPLPSPHSSIESEYELFVLPFNLWKSCSANPIRILAVKSIATQVPPEIETETLDEVEPLPVRFSYYLFPYVNSVHTHTHTLPRLLLVGSLIKARCQFIPHSKANYFCRLWIINKPSTLCSLFA